MDDGYIVVISLVSTLFAVIKPIEKVASVIILIFK